MTEEVGRAHDALIDVHKRIREHFAVLDEELLANLYSDKHYVDVAEHGDGYTLRSTPSCIDELMSLMAESQLVLIVAKFPYLNGRSEFDAHKNLADIPYWRDNVKLRTEDEQAGKSHFWVWQNDCPIHGNRVPNAEDKRTLLLDNRPQMCEVFENQRRESGRLVTACKEWLRARDRKLQVFEHKGLETKVDPALIQLREDRSVSYRYTNVFKPDGIMNLLRTSAEV